MAYNPFLGVTTKTDNGNGDSVNTTYDSAGRPSTSKSPDGAVTTYTYGTSFPFTQTATVTTSDHAQGRSTVTTLDGFGRGVYVVRKDSAGTAVSRVDTTYTATSGAPLGMATTVTRPYLPPATSSNLVSAFDGSGNILSKTLPDTSVTSYSYNGNSVTVTDPAGHYKTVTSNTFGNIIQVVEPNPNSGAYTTTYGYDIFNHLVTVDMGTRDGSTQVACPSSAPAHARVFTYSSTTQQLTSSCEPETGTINYTYNTDGTVHTKSYGPSGSLKSVTYSYDSYGRYTGFSVSSGGGETVGWDGASPNGMSLTTQNPYGRISFKQQKSCTAYDSGASCYEIFNYTPSGHVSSKLLEVYNPTMQIGFPASIQASVTCDNEGRTTSVNYPVGGSALSGMYTYSFDTMGRPNGLANGASTAASGAQYNAADRLVGLTSLAGTESRAYNANGELTNIADGTTINTDYEYNFAADNGQIAQSVNRLNGETVMYAYDALNRLASAKAFAAPIVQNPGFENATTSPWTGSGTLSATQAHNGTKSLYVPASSSANQTISGCVPGASYMVNAWVYRAAGTATLTVGTTGVSGSTSSGSGWQMISASGTASGTTLAISLSTSGTSSQAYWDDVSMSVADPSSPTLTWGQTFGYDGFGNLTSQTPIGTAPTMSLTVNTTTNQVTSLGTTYDGAGNVTYDGTTHYTFDELNRLLTAGSWSYGYAPLGNKRIVTYSPTGTANTPTIVMNLYGPNEKRLSSFTYTKVSGRWQITNPSDAVNYLYIGGKALNYAEDRIGSNQSQTTFWPYGQRRGAVQGESQTFGTYVQDESGLLYADQRYYMPNWGRYLTGDPGRRRRASRRSTSLNKYTYSLNDPINRHNRRGTCSDLTAGITQTPDSGSGAQVYDMANGMGAVSSFPYQGLNAVDSLGDVLLQAAGYTTNATGSAGYAAQFAISQSPTGEITLYLFSGGAAAANAAWNDGQIDASKIQYVVYVEPGLGDVASSGPATVLGGTQGTFYINNELSPKDDLAGYFPSSGVVASQGPPIQFYSTNCDHDFACAISTPATNRLDGSTMYAEDLDGPRCSSYDYIGSDEGGGEGGTPDGIEDPDGPREDDDL